MTIANNNIVARVAAVVAGFALVASSFVAFAPAANAQSSADLEAQIKALMAQIAALQAQAGGSASAGTTFTRDLTIGASGADVTALQNWLISGGFAIPAGATGYFGAQTAAALGKYQASVGISPAAGYFGPITRAKVNGTAGGSTGGNTGGNTGSGDLEGGAGSIDEYKLISSLNGEEVGEDEEDAEVAGLEIEVDDGSDIEFSAVRLTFVKTTNGANSSDDFEDYASEVSIWLDGEEVARVDADEFNDDNDFSKTVSLDRGAIIRAGEKGELTVAVSGASNIDSDDLDESWSVDFEQVRFRDADGATISDNPGTSAREFDFVSFSSAADVELKIAEDDDDVNEGRTIEIDDSNTTDDVDVLSFTLEAEGDSDLEIKSFGVGVTVTGETTSENMISDIRLVIDGEEFSGDYEYHGGDTYVFDDVDYTIDAGDTVSAMIVVDFLGSDDIADGSTIRFTLGETETDQSALVDVEDESGENLGDDEITGSVSSGPFDLGEAGIMVTFISASESVTTGNSANDDAATFTIKYNVEAFGDTVYVSKSGVATENKSDDQPATLSGNAAAVVFNVLQGSTATTADLSSTVTYSDADGNPTDSSNGVMIEEGESADFTLSVSRTNNTTGDAGLYQAALKAIGWNTNDSTTWNLYDFDLDQFETDPITLN